MNTGYFKIIVIIILGLAVAAVFYIKPKPHKADMAPSVDTVTGTGPQDAAAVANQNNPPEILPQIPDNQTAVTTTQTNQATQTAQPKALPKLIDLGAGKCIPCKKMAPILETLKKEFKDKFIVEFIDVWENTDAGQKYGIRLIPTQIFYDASGKEVFRHEGFFSREEILEQFRKMGIDTAAKK